MKEAMRMHPGVGFPLERLVPGGAIVCESKLPAGTNVSISPPVIHFDKNIFRQGADEFRQERWLEVISDQLKTMDRNFLLVSCR